MPHFDHFPRPKGNWLFYPYHTKYFLEIFLGIDQEYVRIWSKSGAHNTKKNWWYYQVSKLLDFVNKEVEDNQDEAESLIEHEDRRKDNLEMEIVVHHNGAYEESDRGENAKIR